MIDLRKGDGTGMKKVKDEKYRLHFTIEKVLKAVIEVT